VRQAGSGVATDTRTADVHTGAGRHLAGQDGIKPPPPRHRRLADDGGVYHRRGGVAWARPAQRRKRPDEKW